MMRDVMFYTYKDGTKCELCKSCLTSRVDNFDEETYLWILEKFDVPYLPWEWTKIRNDAFTKNPNLNGTSVLGKYLAKMKLKQYSKDKNTGEPIGWKDSERLQAEHKKSIEANQTDIKAREQAIKEVKEKYETGEISEAEYQTMMNIEALNREYQEMKDSGMISVYGNNQPAFVEDTFISEEELPDPAAELTHEDKLYLAVKWGRLYKPAEWVSLEKKDREMRKSFTIDDSDSESSLKFICKTELKMDQALDSGDYDGFQKLSRVNDALRKSAKFTAVQNKKEKTDFLDSVGELVAYCEKEGHKIPRFELDEPIDKVDIIIKDLKDYNKTLIYSDPSLATQIESYLKQRVALEEIRKDKEQGKTELTDKDYEDYYLSFEDNKEEIIEGISEED